MPILLTAVKYPEHAHIAPCPTIGVEHRESVVSLPGRRRKMPDNPVR